MPLGKYITLKGVSRDCPNGTDRVRITICKGPGTPVDTIDVTGKGTLDKANLERLMREHFQDFKTEVKFPVWLK